MSLSERLSELATAAEELEGDLLNARQEINDLAEQVASRDERINELELELAEAEADEDLYDLIADVRRGIRTLDELYERTIA